MYRLGKAGEQGQPKFQRTQICPGDHIRQGIVQSKGDGACYVSVKVGQIYKPGVLRKSGTNRRAVKCNRGGAPGNGKG